MKEKIDTQYLQVLYDVAKSMEKDVDTSKVFMFNKWVLFQDAEQYDKSAKASQEFIMEVVKQLQLKKLKN